VSEGGKEGARDALALLFLCLDHRDASLRLLADQTIDSILRRNQLKFQALKSIVALMIELSKKSPARTICAALAKLATVIHHQRSHRAPLYALHFMNSVCMALKRPEEAVQSAVEKNFPLIFQHLGPFVAPAHVEKAEELYQIALARYRVSQKSAYPPTL